jgi:hypothetical protein
VYEWYDSMASELSSFSCTSTDDVPLPNARVDLSGCFFLSNAICYLVYFDLPCDYRLFFALLFFALSRQLFAEAVYLYVENSFLRGVDE